MGGWGELWIYFGRIMTDIRIYTAQCCINHSWALRIQELLKMKPYKSLVISILIIILSSCSPVSIGQSSIPTPTELETTSNIYGNALAYGDYLHSENSSVDYCSSNNLAIYYTSLDNFSPKRWERFRDDFPEMDQETWENFLKINLEPINLPLNLDIGCKYILVIPEMSIESYYYLSRIGFNSLK
ncbi:MAG TPA: hypothetical protein PK989_09810, partial [Anaerolineales bacterium]|nr:hypothetical protein [Anaerolineales bacterium]